jgi:purine nucleosidase
MPIDLVGWQLCRGDANVNAEEIAAIRKMDTALAHFAIDCNRVAMEANRTQTGEIGIALPDPVAMAVALDPSVATDSSVHHVAVETASELTRGMTVVDRLNVASDARNRGLWSEIARDREPSVRVIWSIDVPLWKRMLLAALA